MDLSRTRPSGRAWTVLALVGLTAAGAWLRTTNAASVLVAGRVVFPENDPYFHMHRVLEVLGDFPAVPLYDRFIDFPLGGPIIWPPLFDLFVASTSRALGFGASDRHAVEMVAALLIPVLGGLTAVPVYLLARQIVARGWALVAAALAILVPAHVWYSRLGMVDHHVAVTLLQVSTFALFLGACGAAVAAPGGARAWTRRMAGWLAAGGAAIAAGILTWNGYLLFVAILDAFLVLRLIVEPAAARSRLAALAGGTHLFAALAVAPVAVATVLAGGGPFSPLLLSYLQPAILAAVAAAAFAIAAISSSARLRGSRGAAAVAVAAVIAAILVLAATQRAGFARGLAWLRATDPFMGSVQEVVPLLRGADGALALEAAQKWATRFLLAAPLLLAALLVTCARERFADRGRSLLLIWAGALLALALGQRRFAESFAPALAVLVAWGLAGLDGFLVARLARREVPRRTARAVSVVACVVLVALALAPYYGAFVGEPARLLALPRALSASRAAAEVLADATGADPDLRVYGAAERLRRLIRTNPEPGDGNPDAESGAMNPWPIGHKLIYVAGLPVASTPFGAHARPEAFGDWADFLLTGDEAAAVASLQRRRLRWVVVDGDLPPIGSAIVARGENPRDYYGKRLDLAGGVEIEPRPPLLRSLYFRLTRWIGSAATLAGGSEREEEIPALEHFRLLLDSADDASRGSIKAFELVPGAELGISGPPGAPLALEYAFTSDTGRDRVYRRTVTLDAGGRAQVRVPYSSARPDLGQVSAWRLTGLGIDQRIPVSERAVRRGERIAVTAAPAGVGDRAGENGHRAGENGHRAGENGDGAGENGHRAGDVAG